MFVYDLVCVCVFSAIHKLTVSESYVSLSREKKTILKIDITEAHSFVCIVYAQNAETNLLIINYCKMKNNNIIYMISSSIQRNRT